MKDTVKTNIGDVPIMDYLDMRACACGYDSYEEFYNDGMRIPGYENIAPNN